jgi:hypothetical protein
VLGQDAAGDGERDAGAITLEQSGIQLEFKLPDLGANSGLRTIARLGRLRETLETNYLKERMKLVKIHGAKKRN